MKLEDLFEAATPLSLSQFKIEDDQTGKIKVKTTATSGLPVAVIKTLAFFNSPTNKELIDYPDDDSLYFQFLRNTKNLSSKIKTYTLSGKELGKNPLEIMKFKSNGLLLDGQKDDIIELLKQAIDYHVKQNKADIAYQAGATERKKAASKFNSEKTKERKAALEKKYGKNVIDRVKIRQIGGDDGYQWNVIVDGKSVMNGLTKRSAEFEREQQWKRLAKINAK